MGSEKPEVIVITGASAGVGRAAACEFARRKCRIALLARGAQGLEAARRDVEARGSEALVIPTDMADYRQVESAADRIESTFGPIDIWVNNAMATVFAPLWEISAEEYRRVTEVTYLGYVHGTMAAVKRMRMRNRGTIVQVGSALAYRSIPLQSAYCGAKFAIRGFTDSLRCELLHEGSKIHITMVQMPALNTPQFTWCKNMMPKKGQPVPPIYQPEVAARAIVWSAYHKRRELEVGLMSVVVIWGNKLLPALGDRYLAKTGFVSQQYDGPDDPNRPHNLWKPMDDSADAGAHGSFDKRAKTHSLQLWMFTRPGHPIIGYLLAAGACVWTIARIIAGFRRGRCPRCR
jgi:short-subunit dehydrogenase